MDTEEHKIEMQTVCTIQIGFPVTDDLQAIEYKKKISNILLDIPKVRIEFSLISVPKITKPNAG